MTDDARARAELARVSERLAQTISAVADLAKQRRSTGFVVPVVEADPAADDPTNLWLLADGRLRTRTPDGLTHEYAPFTTPVPIPTFASNPAFSSGHRLWLDGGTGELRGYLANGGTAVRYAPITAGSSSAGTVTPAVNSTVSKPADPGKKSYRKTYSTNWQRTFCQVHGIEGGSDGDHYGKYDSTHGERKIMFGFPDGTMRSDLAGSTITKVELKMQNTHSWGTGDVTIHFGMHSYDTAPGSFHENRKDMYIGSWPHSGWGGGADKWRTVSSAIARRFRDDVCRGMTIDQPTGRTSYGACNRDSLQLRISYVK